MAKYEGIGSNVINSPAAKESLKKSAELLKTIDFSKFTKKKKKASKQTNDEPQPTSNKPLIIGGIVLLLVGVIGFIIYKKRKN